MKEKIYTIPINEAFESDCSCPLCLIEKRLESEAVEYALGAAMMEPDYRIESNEKGYCRRHFSQLLKSPNKLSLALVLETHLDEIMKNLKENEKAVASLGKTGLFKKSVLPAAAEKISAVLDGVEHKCVVCGKVDNTMERYCSTLLYMWSTDDDFKKKFSERELCLRHSGLLYKKVQKELKDQDAEEFVKTLFAKQNDELLRRRELVHKFTLKFDYRYRDMELGEARTAVFDAVEKLCGYIDSEDNE